MNLIIWKHLRDFCPSVLQFEMTIPQNRNQDFIFHYHWQCLHGMKIINRIINISIYDISCMISYDIIYDISWQKESSSSPSCSGILHPCALHLFLNLHRKSLFEQNHVQYNLASSKSSPKIQNPELSKILLRNPTCAKNAKSWIEILLRNPPCAKKCKILNWAKSCWGILHVHDCSSQNIKHKYKII